MLFTLRQFKTAGFLHKAAGFLRKVIWGAGLVAYGLFVAWYTNIKGPITDVEIDQFMETLATRDLDADQLWRLRQFMEQDTGQQFIMINALDLVEKPPNMPVASSGADANKWLEHMYPELLKHASHPVFLGQAMHLPGVTNANHAIDMGFQAQVSLMRYRSRRDLMAVISGPIFLERHDYRLATLTKTITYPVEPSFYLSDFRVLVGLLMFTFLLLMDWLFFRRRSAAFNEHD